MTTTYSVDDRPGTHEMVVIHRIFQRGFTMLTGVADRVPSGDTGRARAVAAHVEFLLNGLHHHHVAEDTYLWPLLAERAEPDAALVARMSDQHEAVAQHIGAEAAAFLRNLPLPVRLIWHLAGRRRYARHMSAVLGLRP